MLLDGARFWGTQSETHLFSSIYSSTPKFTAHGLAPRTKSFFHKVRGYVDLPSRLSRSGRVLEAFVAAHPQSPVASRQSPVASRAPVRRSSEAKHACLRRPGPSQPDHLPPKPELVLTPCLRRLCPKAAWKPTPCYPLSYLSSNVNTSISFCLPTRAVCSLTPGARVTLIARLTSLTYRYSLSHSLTQPEADSKLSSGECGSE